MAGERVEALDLNPVLFPRGPVGCLLIHGGTGSPPEMRPMGEYLAQKGLTVLGGAWRGMRLPPRIWPELRGRTWWLG